MQIWRSGGHTVSTNLHDRFHCVCARHSIHRRKSQVFTSFTFTFFFPIVLSGISLCALFFFFRLAACICDVCFVTRPSADDDDDDDDEDNKKQFTICLLYLSFFLSPLFRTFVAFVVVASRTLMCSVNRGSINSKSCTKSRSDLRF